ncbi:MAG: efflux RND transporter periplasmic adaptor subunit [Rikenellaceae bacterium]
MKILRFFALALAFMFASCGDIEHTSSSVRRVKCAQVQQYSSIFSVTEFPGKVTSATDVNLGFRVAGIIERVPYNVGDYVPSGSVLAVMDRRDYELQLRATQAEYDGIKAEVDRVVALYADSSVSQNDYDKAVHGLKMISAKLDSHQNALDDTELRAPFSGYVHQKNFDRGEAVSAGMPVVSFISSSSPEIVVNLPSEDYIKRSQLVSATASFDLYPEVVFPLELKSISPKANLNQLYEARFVVEPTAGVTPSVGMISMVTINYSQQLQDRVVIPFSAVFEREGLSMVWVLRDGVVNSVRVKISEILSGGLAVVDSGLAAHDVVVSAGVNSLKEGEKVNPLEEVSPTNIGGLM